VVGGLPLVHEVVDHVAERLHHGRLEQPDLVAEVPEDQGLPHPGRHRDLPGAGSRVTTRGEQLAGGVQQQAADHGRGPPDPHLLRGDLFRD